ncbi:MAG TPA: aminotransferase class I/II-fold pyridoxal phosphate-dependent enzyme [Candidatus Saccharimonadales bacterium]|nr:aminotransferase class I/II-fold pyridoxal phosphate-dependent enzyme [Candidatus Saccharimonadales bacterium]
MKIKPFALERYFAKYEFSVKHLLSSSDCDGLSVKYLLELADPKLRKMWEELQLGYTESSGLPLLRAEIARLYDGVGEDDILVLAPEEGIFLTMNVLLNKEDHVICMYPGYQSLYEIASSIGCELTKWLPQEDDLSFDLSFLEKNIKPNTKLIIVNFPHNPTGSTISKEDFQKIVEIAKSHGIYLFSDEMYRFLELDPRNRLPSAVELYDKAISLFGMSKTFGMAGTRIGWVATKDKKLLVEIATQKDYTTIASSAPSEILTLIALRAKDTIIDMHLTRIKRNLDLLDAFFERHKDTFSWVRPIAGTICFPKLLNGRSSQDFCQEVIDKTSILLLPSRVYDYDDSHFRIGFGRSDMPQVLNLFEDYINQK